MVGRIKGQSDIRSSLRFNSLGVPTRFIDDNIKDIRKHLKRLTVEFLKLDSENTAFRKMNILLLEELKGITYENTILKSLNSSISRTIKDNNCLSVDKEKQKQ